MGVEFVARQKRWFWSKAALNRANGCLEWTGGVGSTGYPFLHLFGAPVGGHRMAYMLSHGPIPRGKWVLHKCDNARCINPRHLYLGGAAENSRDMTQRFRVQRYKRLATHCQNGHEYTPDNVYWLKDMRPRKTPGLQPLKRRCRTCALASVRRHQERKEALKCL